MSSKDFTDLVRVLAFLSGSVGAGFWMHLVSTVIRNWTQGDPRSLDSGLAVWVHDLNSFKRLIFTAAVSISVPLIAGLILMFVPSEWLTAAQPVFALVASILIVYFVQQGYYQAVKVPTLPAGTITATTTPESSTVTVAPSAPDPKLSAPAG